MNLKSEMPCISVIIPVYNVQGFLEACMESVLHQTYRNIEVILVDDGSTDNSPSICQKYVIADERVKLITKPNGGLSDARNVGMSIAKGDYWLFIDSDDIIANNLIEHLWDVLISSKADISICDPCHCYVNSPAEFVVGTKIRVFSKEDAIKEMLYQKSFLVSAWGKLYKRKVFENQQFPKGKLFEDSAIMYKVFDHADKIAYSNAKLYGYMHRENSITTRKFDKRDCDILEISNCIVDYFSEREKHILKAAKAYQTNSALRILLNAPKTDVFNDVLLECNRTIKKNFFEVLFDRHVRFKLRAGLILSVFFRPLVPYIYKRVDRWK